MVALAGDGGLTMLFGELLTLSQNRLPVKVIVFNNSSLNFVELEMKAAGIVNFGTELVNPDFARRRAGDGAVRQAGRAPRRAGAGADRRVRARRPRGGRRRHRAPGVVHPAGHHGRAGEGFLAVRDPDDPGRAGPTSCSTSSPPTWPADCWTESCNSCRTESERASYCSCLMRKSVLTLFAVVALVAGCGGPKHRAPATVEGQASPTPATSRSTATQTSP